MGTLAVAAPAAPLVPALALSGTLLVLLVAALATWATLRLYDYSLGALLRKIADLVDVLPFVGGFAADALDDADRFVQRQLGKALDGLNESTARTWDALTAIVKWTADTLYDLNAATFEAFTSIVQGEIPTQVTDKVRPLGQALGRTRTDLNERLRAEALARSRGIDALDRDLTREALARQRGIDAVNERITARVFPRVRALERSLADVWGYTRRTLARRLSRVEKLVLGGALAVGATSVLVRRFPWHQCTNVKRFNRALCRSPISDWTALLGLLAFVVVALDPERIARLAEDASDELGGIIRTMAGVEG